MNVRLPRLIPLIFTILSFVVISSCEMQYSSSKNYFEPLSLKMHKTGSTSGSLPGITYTTILQNDDEHEYATIAHISPCSLERNGYPLVAWNTKSDYTGIFIPKFGNTNRDQLKSSDDDMLMDFVVDLYPVWQEEGTGYVIIPGENNTAKAMLYIGDDAVLVMPETIAGRTVIEIGNIFKILMEPAFSPGGGFTITSIDFPNKLESIEQNAFDFCRTLTSVTFPDTLRSIGKESFSYTGLTAVSFPISLRTIGNYAFYSSGLVTASFANKDCDIGEGAFSAYTDLIIHAPAGGTVETYCSDNSITFEAI